LTTEKTFVDMLGRATTLSCGAAGGLFLLFSHSPLITLALAFFLGWSWLQDWLRGPMCPSNARLDGKLAVVTGSNTGIGRETAKGLAARGARVVLACRNVKQAQEVADEIESTGGRAEVMELDLQSFDSVRRFAAALAAKFPKLDILVNNAGVAFQPKQMTKDGEEQVMQVNHLSPFLLTNLLLDMLNAAGKARVVNLSSLMHTWAKEGIQWDDLKWEKKPFDSWSAYAQSKLANIYFTRELARRQGAKSGVTIYAVHPGAVDSDLGRSYRDKIPAFVRKYLTDFVKVFLKTSEHGAQTSIYCAVEQSLEKETGKYYADCERIAPAAFALDDKQAKKLWEVSKSIVGDISPLKPTGEEVIGSSSTVTGLSKAESSLYSSKSEGNKESTHSHLMTEIKAFPEDSVLAPTKFAESVGGAGLLVQEMMVRDVETFDKAELRPTETQEPLTGAELVKKEFETKSINAEVASFDKADLRETEVEEKNVLPNERDIKLEREKVELIGGIENFDVDNLARVTVREPVSGAELLKQELGHRAVQEEIGVFNQETLKATQVKEGGWLPDQQVIQEEKDKVDHLASIEGFQADDLNKVKTVEPLSGAELLKRELTHKAVTEEVASFDVGKMKQTEVEERNLLPDSVTLAEEKTRETLLTGVETFSHESLSHVKTPEPVTGAELLKQEMNIKSIVDSVTTFDSTSLRSATTEEKVLLPDAEMLKSERDRASLMANIESGDHALTPVSPKEPLGGAELLKQELTHSQVLEKVEGFDMGGLRHSEVVERINLPDEATIQAEKTHVEHLATIGAFDQASLTPVKVVEPLTGPEVAMLEKAREGISSELAAFDKADLKETEVEEKMVLPGKEDIAQERGHLEHMAGLEAGLELRKTETREPASPLDLAKLELHKDQVEEELQAFDRARLTPVVTEEKVFLPSADELRAAEMEQALEVESPVGASGLRDLLTDDNDSRERRSSSEEWEKVDGAESEC